MGQTVEVELKLIDNLSKNWEAVEKSMSAHFNSIEQAAGRTGQAFQATEQKSSSLMNAELQLDQITKGLAVHFENTGNASHKLGTAIGAVQGQSWALSGALKNNSDQLMQATGHIVQTATATQHLGVSIDSIKTHTAGATAAIKSMEDATLRLQQKFDALNPVLPKTDEKVKQHQSAVSGLQQAYYALAAIAGGMVVREIYKAGTQVEDLTVQFKTLLGSTAAAHERLRELSRFAADTPFELGEVANASRTLEIFTHGAFSSGEALRKIGDAASGTGNSFQEVAFWVGRLYGGLQQGTPIGQESMRLSEMAILSGEARRKIEALAHAHAPLSDSLKVLDKEFLRFNGSMDAMSRTVSGRVSTSFDDLRESVRQVLAGGAWDHVNEAVAEFNKTVEDAIASGALKKFGQNIDLVTTAGRDFFIVWGGGKIATITKELYLLATASETWGAAMAWANKNPAMIALAAGVITYEATIAVMKNLHAEADLGNTDWMRTAGNVDKAKGILNQYTDAQKNLSDITNRQKNGEVVPTKELDQANIALMKLDRSFRELSGKSIADAKKAGIDFALAFTVRDWVPPKNTKAPPETHILSAAEIAAAKQIEAIKAKANENELKREAEFQKHLLKIKKDEKTTDQAILEDELKTKLIYQKRDEEARKTLTDTAAAAMKSGYAKSVTDIGARKQDELAAFNLSEQAKTMGFMQAEMVRTNIAKKYANERALLDKKVTTDSLTITSSTLGNIMGLYHKHGAAYKVWAEGKNAVDTALAAMSAYAAAQDLPYPAGLIVGPISAGFAIAYGLKTASDIAGAGFEVGGYTGYGPRGQVAGKVHKDEYVVNSPTLNRLGGPAGVEAALYGRGGDSMSIGEMHFHFGGAVDGQMVTAVGNEVNSRVRAIANDFKNSRYRNVKGRG